MPGGDPCHLLRQLGVGMVSKEQEKDGFPPIPPLCSHDLEKALGRTAKDTVPLVLTMRGLGKGNKRPHLRGPPSSQGSEENHIQDN